MIILPYVWQLNRTHLQDIFEISAKYFKIYIHFVLTFQFNYFNVSTVKGSHYGSYGIRRIGMMFEKFDLNLYKINQEIIFHWLIDNKGFIKREEGKLTNILFCLGTSIVYIPLQL